MRACCREGIDSRSFRLWHLLVNGIAFFLLMGIFPQGLYAHTFLDQQKENLLSRIRGAGKSLTMTLQGELIQVSPLLPLFYQRHGYKLGWYKGTRPLPQTDALLKYIRKADRDGLEKEDYHLAEIEQLMGRIKDYSHNQPSRRDYRREPLHRLLTDLDLLLTDAFLTYASHLKFGRVNPEDINPEWKFKKRPHDISHLLQDALDSNRIEEVLKGLLPQQFGYMKMRRVLARYRTAAAKGGWPALSPNLYPLKATESAGRPAEASDFVKNLRRYLAITGDLGPGYQTDRDEYDASLKQAVRRFQQRHGLEVDGLVGPETLEAMSVPIEERIRQIELNMERCRWLPRDFGKRTILINIAGYELEAMEDGNTVLNMRVVIGKPQRPTPILNGNMNYLVFNPSWYIPSTIAQEDILPSIKKNPNFFSDKKIKVLKANGKKVSEVDPELVEWSASNLMNSGFQFRQDPGAGNPLGRVKFIFPNKFSVYIHDTVARELFKKSKRTFSSGCIRIENPLELAEFVLKGNKKWTRQGIMATIEKGKEQSVSLPEPVPVHLVYLTSWVDGQGTIHFRPDIYAYDNAMLTAWRKSPQQVPTRMSTGLKSPMKDA